MGRSENDTDASNILITSIVATAAGAGLLAHQSIYVATKRKMLVWVVAVVVMI